MKSANQPIGSELLHRLAWLGGYALAGLIFLLIIPRDPKNVLFLGFSSSRLLMIGGLLALLLVIVVIFMLIRQNLALQDAIEVWLQRLGAAWFMQLIFFICGLLILTSAYLVVELVLTSDEQKFQLWLRILPIMLLIAGFAVEMLRAGYWRNYRRLWFSSLMLSGASLILLVFIQENLLAQIDRFYRQDIGMVYASRLGSTAIFLSACLQVLRRTEKERNAWLMVLVLAIGLFWLQWIGLPPKYWPARPLLALWGVGGSIALALVCLWLVQTWQNLELSHKPRWIRLVQAGLVLTLALLVIPYINAAVEHSRTLNHAPIYTDQGEYLRFAINARLNNFRYTGDHNRMPGYPFLQGLFYRPGMSEAEFFWQGKLRNVALSIIFLALFTWISRRYVGTTLSLLLGGIVAFSLYIFKAPYFQAEISFYFLAFLAYLLMMIMLNRPSLGTGLLLGVISGLAHLLKASIIPGLGLYFVVYFGGQLINGWRKTRTNGWTLSSLKPFLLNLLAGGLVLLSFIIVIFPYINAMKARFGQYFYNVNTTFYVWYDDNFEAIAAENQHRFAERWPSHLSEDELPNLRNYLRTHTVQQIGARILFGLREQTNNILQQFSVTNFHLSYMVILGIPCLANWRTCLALIHRYPQHVLFASIYLIGYLAAFVWYSPISPERRFTYGLYLPFMFSVFFALQAVQSPQANQAARFSWLDIRSFSIPAHLFMTAVLMINIYLVLTERMFYDRFGA
jgi:hypothetical protein